MQSGFGVRRPMRHRSCTAYADTDLGDFIEPAAHDDDRGRNLGEVHCLAWPEFAEAVARGHWHSRHRDRFEELAGLKIDRELVLVEIKQRHRAWAGRSTQIDPSVERNQ